MNYVYNVCSNFNGYTSITLIYALFTSLQCLRYHGKPENI